MMSPVKCQIDQLPLSIEDLNRACIFFCTIIFTDSALLPVSSPLITAIMTADCLMSGVRAFSGITSFITALITALKTAMMTADCHCVLSPNCCVTADCLVIDGVS